MPSFSKGTSLMDEAEGINFYKKIFEHYKNNLEKIISFRGQLNESLDFVYILLFCLIDELSGYIYPKKEVGIRFKKVLSEYDPEIFNKIDLCYFFHWENFPSRQKNDKKLREDMDLYRVLREQLSVEFQEEDIQYQDDKRYQDLTTLIELLDIASIKPPNINKITLNIVKTYLNHFTNANFAYHFGRCMVVHEGKTLLLSSCLLGDQKSFEENHLITIDVLKNLITKIINDLEKKFKNDFLNDCAKP
jgi:hypothetical protein